MIRRILLTLDNSAPGIRAQQYAIDLAKASKAAVTGIGILDTPWITAAQPEPLGGSTYRMERDDAVLSQSTDHVNFLIGEFSSACGKAGVKHQSMVAEGFPAVEIEKLAHEHDVIVIGKTTDFHSDFDEDSDLTVKHLARDNARPLFIIPEKVPETNSVLVAFDGSLQASRAIHMFILLGLAKDKKIHIVSLNKDLNQAEFNATRAHNLFSAHGLETTAKWYEQKGNLGEQLISHAHDVEASMMVMGGFSHTAIREAFFGSATKSIMKNCSFPLFLHH